MTADTDTLPLFELAGAERVLVVVAHPDDAEYGASCAVASWTAAGVEVTYLLLTRGEAGIRGLDPAETAVLREAEQRAGCAAVGVRAVRFLDAPDGELVAGLELRRAVTRVIRQVRPDVVVTITWELEAPWGLNHADHRVCGVTVVDAVRDADNPWTFRELLEEEGLEPWKAPRLVVTGHRALTHGIDVTGEPLEQGIASLEAHAAYLAALPDHPAPREMLTGMTAAQGPRAGVANAVLVHVWDM
ncbi:PIG-L family deacetylase [Miniimonas arenae]|uniref:PIG-L family deacetylase n=1 Tax=Miniimonas arenae TaxID=676201 RepID=A0A5C5BAS7_9MICO|nr:MULTISPECIES: PIG-L deacetylase family protein [Miniimonas]TNU73624.1 PIG-L family deacetylase [Miniimonas arenae]